MVLCNICRYNIVPGQCIFMTDCKHFFHTKCFRPTLDSVWFILRCPACNTKVKKNKTKLLMMPLDN